MQKLLLIFGIILSSVAFGQNDSLNVDVVNRLTYKEWKKQLPELQNEKQRNIVIEFYEKIKNDTKDSELILWIEKDIEEVKSAQFAGVKYKDLSTIDSKELKKFEIDKDKFKDKTIIKRKWVSTIADVYPYISLFEGEMFLRLKINYSGRDWVFFKKVIFLVDGEKFEFIPTLTDTNIGSSATVYEYSDTRIDSKTLLLVEKIANAKTVEYQLNGKYTADRKMKSNAIEYFKSIVDLYNQLKK